MRSTEALLRSIADMSASPASLVWRWGTGLYMEGELPELALTSTPLRRALVRERAEVMKAALAALPGELREVVRLRVFEERCTEDVARELGIGLSAAKHRFRKGAALYRERLQHEWATRSGAREGKA